jgi:2-oxoglutarate-Fe(II)-dependent oxygenase superfamily protein
MRLEQWIDQRHLRPAAMASYAAAFASVPYSSVVIDNFLKPEKFAALQRVFSTEGEFAEKNFLWGWVNGKTKGSEEVVSSEVWHAAPDEHRASVESMFIGARPDYRTGRGIINQIKFMELLRSADFTNFLESVTGIRPAKLTCMMVRIFVGGQYIRPHGDFDEERDLCGVFYASPEWQPSFGGRFRHHGPGPDIVPIEPLPNRLLLFEPRADCKHDVEAITADPARWQRWAYTIWFGTPKAINTPEESARSD